MFPLNLLKSIVYEKNLRKQCVAEIFEAAKKSGIEFTYFSLNHSKRAAERNQARIALEDFKRKNLDYSIEFYVLEDYSPIFVLRKSFTEHWFREKNNFISLGAFKYPTARDRIERAFHC